MTESVKVGSEGRYTIGLIDEDRIKYIKAMNTERGTCKRICSWHGCRSKQLSPDAISL